MASPTTEMGRAERARIDAKIDSLGFRIYMRIQGEPRTMTWLINFFRGANEDYVREAVWRLIDAGKATINDERRLQACLDAAP